MSLSINRTVLVFPEDRETMLTCLSLAPLPHNVWTMARSCMEEDEGTLDICKVKHLEKLQVERIRLTIKAAGL